MGQVRVIHCKRDQLRNGEVGYYCGRGRAPIGFTHAHMGNPFRIDTNNTREQVIAQYHAYLRDLCRTDTPQRRMVLHMASEYVAGKDIALACWCAPRACHCDIIALAIRGYAQRMHTPAC